MSHACGDVGHHVIAANSFLVHLMLWHVTWQCWYSTVQTSMCYSHAYCVNMRVVMLDIILS